MLLSNTLNWMDLVGPLQARMRGVCVRWGSEPLSQNLQQSHAWSDIGLCPSERTMDLVLEMCNTRSVHWCGVSGRQLGKVGPSAFLSLPLKLLSSVQGLQVRAAAWVGRFEGGELEQNSMRMVLEVLRSLIIVFYLLIPEYLWTAAHRYLSEEDL